MEQTRVPPQFGKYKVFIIDEVHMLSAAAFNAFLKTLEEPPAHVVFILATTEKHKVLPTILSRCQIYDFERMTVPETINQLKMIAQKEGIEYEDEALNVIAEKADGGMRDALSIFDQVASFCQGHITYEKVLEDLNVLDSENYFRLVDLSLENKVADIMSLLNGLLSKGFDGGNIVDGLASHLRNVLMAKDAQTLPLIETSDAQRQRYQEQAVKCPARFIYQALKILNQCDVNYRQSSNKRLLVELTLIEVAQITQEDDVPGAGRRPGRLKSLFNKLKNNVNNMPVQQVTGDVKVARHTDRTETRQQAPVAIPKLKMKDMVVSFAGLRKQNETEAEPAESDKVEVADNQQFTLEQLQVEWLAMCQRMPQQLKSTAVRLKNAKLIITDFPNIEVVVDSQLVLEEAEKIKGRIRRTMAENLHNGSIQISLRLAKAEEVEQVLTDREFFEQMRKENAVIEKFRASLDLELA